MQIFATFCYKPQINKEKQRMVAAADNSRLKLGALHRISHVTQHVAAYKMFMRNNEAQQPPY
jgi:hypothetical protein